MKKKTRKQSGLRVPQTAVTGLVTLILLEITVRIWLGFLADEQSFYKYASMRQLRKLPKLTSRKWTPHRYLGYYPTPDYSKGENKHNSLGYRGDEIDLPKPSDRFRIVCLGGSTTYTTEIDDYKMSYPDLLEHELKQRGYDNVDVINAGVGAWTTCESLVNLQIRVLDLEPDMIIIYHAVNDLLMRFVWPHEAYRADNSGARQAPGMFMPGLLEHSTLCRYVMIRLDIVQPHSYLDRHFTSAPDTAYAGAFQTQKANGTYPSGIFKETSAKQMLAANPPVYFTRNLENMVAIADSHGMTTVLATFAHSDTVEGTPMVSSEEGKAALAEMNEAIKSVAQNTTAHLFDFAAEFPDDKQYYCSDGVHVTTEGVKVKARLFADYIVDNKLLPDQQEDSQ